MRPSSCVVCVLAFMKSGNRLTHGSSFGLRGRDNCVHGCNEAVAPTRHRLNERRVVGRVP